MPAERQIKRHRGAVACLRCKSRKHRCDNEYPACGNCLVANQECVYGDGNHPTGYVRSLEDRLQVLEHHVLPREADAAYDPEQRLRRTPAESASQSRSQHLRSPDEPQHQRSEMLSATLEDQSSDTDASALFQSNPYLGISSGFPLATMMQAAISLPEQHGGTAIAPSAWLPAQSDRSSKTKVIAKAAMPSAKMSERLVAAYLNKVHTKHPFLSLRRIHELAEQRQTLWPASQLTPNAPLRSSLDYCTLHLIYAIGARYLQLSEEYDYRPPSDHYVAALVDIELALVGRCLESLEVMTLLSIYQLRSPSEPGIWSVIGATMRQALDCGLHRASGVPPLLDQRRKRIFWTVYMLERSVALTLGRPFCISERDIDVDLPANVADDIDDEQQMLAAIEEATLGPSKIWAISPALHIFRLQRIISRIQYTVHRVDRSTSSIDTTKINQLRAALEQWKAEIGNSVPLTDEHDAPNLYVTHSYHVLQYHKAMLFLLLPTLTWLPASHPDFRVCAAAAGQIGQLYRNLHNTQKARISYSLLALHANLVAGLTLIYCFVAAPAIFDAKFSSGIRACSTVLYIIAERWPAARKARDYLERFVQATVEANVQVSDTHVDGSSLPPNLQQVHDTADGALFGTTAEHVVAQAIQLGIENLPQPDNIWDMLGSVLGDGDSNWFEGVDAQNFAEFA